MYPSAELTFREVMKDTFSSIIKNAKISDSYVDIINAHINYYMNADSSLKEARGNSSKRINKTIKN